MNDFNMTNSSVYQALLDLKKVGVQIDMDSFNATQLREADELFNRHQYPDRHLTFNRVQNIQTNSKLYLLPPNEQAILVAMIGSMSQANLIQVSVESLAELTGISMRSVKTLLRNLISHGFIAVHQNSKKNSPRIYMVNPDLAKSGKGASENYFKKLAGKTYKEYEDYSCKADVAIQLQHIKEANALPYNSLTCV